MPGGLRLHRVGMGREAYHFKFKLLVLQSVKLLPKSQRINRVNTPLNTMDFQRELQTPRLKLAEQELARE